MSKAYVEQDENLAESASAIAGIFGLQPNRAINKLKVREISDDTKVFELRMKNGKKLPLLSAKQVSDYSGLPLDQVRESLADKFGLHTSQGVYRSFLNVPFQFQERED